MSYTITSASWANADNTAAIIQTAESGAVAVSLDRTELWLQFMEWAETNPVAPFVPETAQQITDRQRAAAKRLLNELEATGKALRAIVILVVAELNDLREWTQDFKAAAAAAGTLAAFKTNVAGLADLNNRTLAQARTAIDSILNTDQADA